MQHLGPRKKDPDAQGHDTLREEVAKVCAMGKHPSHAPALSHSPYGAKPWADTRTRRPPPPRRRLL